MENESLLGLDSSPKDPIQTQIDGIDALFKAATLLNWVVKIEKMGNVDYVVVCNPEIANKIEVIVKE